MKDEDSYLLLSGIQHFAFCRRQWALIHIEQLWDENLRTIEGKLLHERAHDPLFTEKRKDKITTRDMPILSNMMRITGKCDVVEFYKDEDRGVPLVGRSGRWRPCPVEYKRGKPKPSDMDRLQLCAQALCLEEMLAFDLIDVAYIYYGETRHREKVELDLKLRASVQEMFQEMHGYYDRRYTPLVKPTKSCNACSLKNQCLPKLLSAKRSVRSYLRENIDSSEVMNQ